MRTCSIDGCEKNHRSRGLCSTHYNQQYQPNRHHRVKACAACGVTYETTRTDGRFCSLLCRDFDRWGPRYSAWPRYKPKPPIVVPPPFRERRVCGWCGDGFVATRLTHVFCSRQCLARSARTRRRGREVDAPGTYTWTEVIKLYLLFDRCCAYCQQRTDDPEPDHVVPLSRGGGNSVTNILPSCKACNSDKRDLLLDEWAKDRARRGLPPRLTRWHPADPRFLHLTSVSAHAA
jgi:5-methylcytosine-specific restriction endonuclease McrA